MKKFKNLEEGLKYHETCILCKSSIEPEIFSESDYDVRGFDYKNQYLQYYLGEGNWAKINFDHTIVITGDSRDYEECYGDYPLKHSFNFGREYIGFHVSCKCNNFYYFLQIVIDWEKRQIENVFLNSESFSIIENLASLTTNNKKYTITNRYALNTTKYHMDLMNESFGMIVKAGDVVSFPLVQINYENPMETLDKVKKLMLFS